MLEPPPVDGPQLITRLRTLLDALRGGPLSRPELLQRLGSAYPATPSARVMIDRDVRYLCTLGIEVTVSRTRPPIYTLHGSTPILSDDELRALELIRDTFGDRHPQAADVHALLTRLTSGLDERQQHMYQRRQPLRAPVQPAIDYTPYATLIARLEAAISSYQVLAFRYRRGGSAQATLHAKVEPYEIEYYDRHFYLEAFSHSRSQVFDFRIDRIQDDEAFQVLYAGSTPPERRLIPFRYRLAAAVAQGGISQRFAQQHVVETLPNGDVIIEAQGRSGFFIRRNLLKYAANAELLEPAWLREELATEVAALAAQYEKHDKD